MRTSDIANILTALKPVLTAVSIIAVLLVLWQFWDSQPLLQGRGNADKEPALPSA